MNPEFLVGSRIVFCALTAILIGSYFRPEARFKWAPSLIAAGLMCSSATIAFQGIVGWHDLIQKDPQPQFAIYTFFVFTLILWCRGDMAVLLDAGTRTHRTVVEITKSAKGTLSHQLRQRFPWWPW